MSELFREALRRYINGDPEADHAMAALLKRTRVRGAELDVRNEADVERLSDEFRQAKRL